MGCNKGATASGVVYGGKREIDHKVGTGSLETVSQQMGNNRGATASGVQFGARREIDLRTVPERRSSFDSTEQQRK
jgi:hypothetical protein